MTQQKQVNWSEPDPRVSEHTLVQYLSHPLTFEFLQPLVVSNMFAVQAAYDRRAKRAPFSDLLIHSMNFNACMTRIAVLHEVGVALGLEQLSPDWLTQQEDTFRTRADHLRKQVVATLELLAECRNPGETVS